MSLEDILYSATDTRAISPVVAVVLLIAITLTLTLVALPVVFGVVSDFGSDQPSAEFAFYYEESGSSFQTDDFGNDTLANDVSGLVTVTYERGDNIDPETITVQARTSGGLLNDTGRYGPSERLQPGQEFSVVASRGETVRVIWNSPDGSESAVLDSFTVQGPEQLLPPGIGDPTLGCEWVEASTENGNFVASEDPDATDDEVEAGQVFRPDDVVSCERFDQIVTETADIEGSLVLVAPIEPLSSVSTQDGTTLLSNNYNGIQTGTLTLDETTARGTVIATQTVTLEDSTADDINADGFITLRESTAGNLITGGGVTLEESTSGLIDADGQVGLDNAESEGITTTQGVTLDESTSGDINAGGQVGLDDSESARISTDGGVTLEDSTSSTIDAGGSVILEDAETTRITTDQSVTLRDSHVENSVVAETINCEGDSTIDGEPCDEYTQSSFPVSITDANDPVDAGETLTVTAVVENDGETEESTELVLRNFDGNEVVSKTVTVDVGETKPVELDWETTSGDEGTGSVTVETETDVDTRQVTIEEDDPEPTPDITDVTVDDFGDSNMDVTVRTEGTDSTYSLDIESFYQGSSIDATQVTADDQVTVTIDGQETGGGPPRDADEVIVELTDSEGSVVASEQVTN